MNDWVNDFLGSRLMKRVVFANYLEHLRRKNEDNRQTGTYASIEDALEDFAQRTGLTDMEKRALRRQVFVKTALDFSRVNMDRDQKAVQTGDAPAAILPGVKPGSGAAKAIEKKKKDMLFDRKSKPEDKQQSDTTVEDTIKTEMPHSGDEAQITSDLNPGIVIEAVEEDPFAAFREEPKETGFKLFDKKKKKVTTPGYKGTKESKLLKEMKDLELQLERDFMEPGSSKKDPKWKKDKPGETHLWQKRLDLESKIREVKEELRTVRDERKEEEERSLPRNKAANDNAKFLSVLDKALKASPEKGQTLSNARLEAIKKLSEEGLQEAFDKAASQYKKDMYHKPSQGSDPEHGEYVKCMICDNHGNLWINRDNPGVLPFWHLETHAIDLLGKPDKDKLYDPKSGKYREEIINTYLRKFPGAALQSREQELATAFESVIETATGRSLVDVPHIATESEKNLTYTDQVLKDSILHQFRRFGVDPLDIDVEELADQTLEELKARLDQEFPGKLPLEGGMFAEIGKLADRDFPFAAFDKAFKEEVGQMIHDYRGETLKTKAPTKREKIRWPSPARQERQRKEFKELREEDIWDELAAKLGRKPTPKEFAAEMKERNLVPVTLSVSGGRGCWNCGKKATVWVRDNRAAINSATCPECGVYREILIANTKGSMWKCPECDELHHYVIRDPNKDDPGGVKSYYVHCDEDSIGKGNRAIGNSRMVFSLTELEREIFKEIPDEPEEPKEGEPPVSEEIFQPVKEGDRVHHPEFGFGNVVFVEGAALWVSFETHKEQKKIQDLAAGDVFLFESKALKHTSGYYKVQSVNPESERGYEIRSISSEGVPYTAYPTKENLDKTKEVMTRINRGEITRKSSWADRRHHRRRLSRRVLAKAGCPGNELFKVERTEKKEPKEEDVGRFRLSFLRNKVRRARLLRRIRS